MINSAPLIRQLGPADRDAYFQLRLRGLKAHPESFGQSYEEAVAKGAARHDAMLQGARAAEGDFLLGAFASANAPLIGVVGLLRSQRDKERHKASVVGMYVAPEAAGRGVGRGLLDELLARAAQIEGLRQIQLMVGSRNEAARKLYESLGFRKYGCEIGALNVNGVFHDADLMARFMEQLSVTNPALRACGPRRSAHRSLRIALEDAGPLADYGAGRQPDARLQSPSGLRL